ncbi:NAD(P)H-hydrate dehydratase [Algoriphagus aestuariicola]|uniref:Bifunctional NAD(P)H-hydrate repair enzyme n=1 Tax=Algoriphagus aestuariicola TaxID=1852016 RepID=A0ABS3BJ88_9BACT|nr:NAD(P)H-hydrate dehydratase [Algoriphagus aestuariicola]MBN7799223.1 NAD(P)H-hydrate dehydratase [Algoriphagus aestuariicola]
MLKILSGSQVKELDAAYINRKGISSLNLMESAASGFVGWWTAMDFDKQLPVVVFCGAGNNGGDGYAIARLLHGLDFEVIVVQCFTDSSGMSPDALFNKQSLPDGVQVRHWSEFAPCESAVVIDAYLGVGLRGPLRQEAVEVIQKINSLAGLKISVDIPSGLPSDGLLDGLCVRADFTVTLAFPKLSLLFPEHASVAGKLVLVDIGIEDSDYQEFPSTYFFLIKKDLKSYHRTFHRFSHKGDFGKIMLFAGSIGKMGAAVLAGKAALRTGSGLVTVQIPESERQVVQTAAPELMCSFGLQGNLGMFDALGVGPAIGVDDNAGTLAYLFQNFPKPMVIDADAITLLGKKPDLVQLIPKGSILTPHLVEFDRILGRSENHLERLEKASDFCNKWGLNMLIKGANSVICLADGRQIFNSSGTHYMATAGAGDVLTGILTSLLGQGYSPEQAMICGVYQHGLAGEIAGERKRRGTIASDIVEAIPETFRRLDIS